MRITFGVRSDDVRNETVNSADAAPVDCMKLVENTRP